MKNKCVTGVIRWYYFHRITQGWQLKPIWEVEQIIQCKMYNYAVQGRNQKLEQRHEQPQWEVASQEKKIQKLKKVCNLEKTTTQTNQHLEEAKKQNIIQIAPNSQVTLTKTQMLNVIPPVVQQTYTTFSRMDVFTMQLQKVHGHDTEVRQVTHGLPISRQNLTNV